MVHPWYFKEPSLRFLLRQLGYRYEVLRDQRYVLANLMIRARDGRLGGIGHFTPASPSIEKFDKKSLISYVKCDNITELARNYPSA